MTLHWSATLWRLLQLAMFCIPYWWEHAMSWCSYIVHWRQCLETSRQKWVSVCKVRSREERVKSCCFLYTKTWSWYGNVFQSILPLASDRLSQTLSYPCSAAFWILSLSPSLPLSAFTTTFIQPNSLKDGAWSLKRGLWGVVTENRLLQPHPHLIPKSLLFSPPFSLPLRFTVTKARCNRRAG